MKKLIFVFIAGLLVSTAAFAQSQTSAQKRMALLPEMRSDTQYVVYFRFAYSTLNPAAEKFLVDVSKNYKTQAPSKIRVAGYADTIGSDKVNMAISLRRAKNVANALNKNGVPSSKITVKGYGETNLAVPTADEVMEPRNRRAVINFVK